VAAAEGVEAYSEAALVILAEHRVTRMTHSAQLLTARLRQQMTLMPVQILTLQMTQPTTKSVMMTSLC